jgi:hypothetical protein
MTNRNIMGDTFALTLCPAWTEKNNEQTKVSGLFTVEDMVYADRTCGQWESGYWIFPAGDASGIAPMYFVDSYTFMEQADPRGFGRMLVQEREMEFAAEMGF